MITCRCDLTRMALRMRLRPTQARALEQAGALRPQRLGIDDRLWTVGEVQMAAFAADLLQRGISLDDTIREAIRYRQFLIAVEDRARAGQDLELVVQSGPDPRPLVRGLGMFWHGWRFDNTSRHLPAADSPAKAAEVAAMTG